jgi:hypothetical protein
LTRSACADDQRAGAQREAADHCRDDPQHLSDRSEDADIGVPRRRERRPSAQTLLRHFGRRDDITPHAFGFELTPEDDGPAYAWSRS